MPFGVIFGALFFAVLGCWFALGASGLAGGLLGPARPFVALLSLSIAVGLLLQRPWARWSGVLWSATLAGLVVMVAMIGGGTAAFVVLFGSLVTAVLLLLPPTGASPAGETPSVAPRLARVTGILAGIGLLGLLGGLGWGVSRAPAEAGDTAEPASARIVGLPERVYWADFGTGLERARAEDKPMLVTFETDWCGYCDKMARTTWKHPSVVERLGEIVAVRVDAEDGQTRSGFTGRELAAEYGVQGFPTILLMDPGGAVLSSTGGYQTPRQFLSWLEDALGRGEPVRSVGA